MEHLYPAAAYAEGLARGVFTYQRCETCGQAVFYPRVLCPSCGGVRLAWEESAGRGQVYATTTVHPRDEDPYNVALVDMDEGVRLMTRVEGVAPEDVRIGMPVQLAVREVGGDHLPIAEVDRG